MKNCDDGGKVREVYTKTTMTKDGYFLDGDMEAPGLTNVPYDADWSRYRDAEVGLTDLLPDEAKGGLDIRGRFQITVTFVANPFCGKEYPTCEIGETLTHWGDCWTSKDASDGDPVDQSDPCPESNDRCLMLRWDIMSKKSKRKGYRRNESEEDNSNVWAFGGLVAFVAWWYWKK